MSGNGVRIIIACALVVVLGGIGLRFYERRASRVSEKTSGSAEGPDSAPAGNISVRKQSAVASKEVEVQGGRESANRAQLQHEKIEEYLKLHNRDAASLLAAYHADGEAGVDYLKEAASNFPGDPRVQLAVLAKDVYPEERRKWLDAFKDSSPNNSLANYLSAGDFFKNNQPAAAMRELLEASGKTQFTDFAMETYLGAQELARFAGESQLSATTAAMAAMAGDLLPQLANLKGIAQNMRDAQKQYLDAGDAASVQNLAQLGTVLANRLTSGDGGRFIISQLVGIATETIALQSLEQSTTYDFLGGKTPAQRLDELKEEKQAIRELSQGFSSAFANATEAEKDGYAERMKIYGEAAAMQWLQQQHAAGGGAK